MKKRKTMATTSSTVAKQGLRIAKSMIVTYLRPRAIAKLLQVSKTIKETDTVLSMMKLNTSNKQFKHCVFKCRKCTEYCSTLQTDFLCSSCDVMSMSEEKAAAHLLKNPNKKNQYKRALVNEFASSTYDIMEFVLSLPKDLQMILASLRKKISTSGLILTSSTRGRLLESLRQRVKVPVLRNAFYDAIVQNILFPETSIYIVKEHDENDGCYITATENAHRKRAEQMSFAAFKHVLQTHVANRK